ncbi:TAZ zinc finger family protein [Aphelenchoides avenae]|nr:TAZ zinc finger family protein [Aphelenchus avenae]
MALLPNFNGAEIHDQREKDVIDYARKLESKFFAILYYKAEYYYLASEKFYAIQKELAEKKRHAGRQLQHEPVKELRKFQNQSNI